MISLKMIKAVIDTNVFLSGLFFGGEPKKVLDLCLQRKIIGITSKEILSELEEKLLGKFEFPPDKTGEFLTLIIKEFAVVEPKEKIDIVEDKKDNKIIEAAMESKADYIVSGDKHLLKIEEYKNIKIVKPKDFLDEIKI